MGASIIVVRRGERLGIDEWVIGSTHFCSTEKRVCIQQSAVEESTVALPTLTPGAQYQTPYGIVEVLFDDRAVPAGSVPTKAALKQWKNRQIKYDQQSLKLTQKHTIQSAKRRRKLRRYYESGHVNQKTVFQACFGSDPRLLPYTKPPPPPGGPPPNPAQPEESFPNRIVECQLIPDRRSRFLGEDPVDSLEDNVPHTRLFLQRYLLTDVYIPETEIIHCQRCGQIFGSWPGFRYHDRAGACDSRKGAKREAHYTWLKGLDHVVDKLEPEPRAQSRVQIRERKDPLGPVYTDVFNVLGMKFAAAKPAPKRVSAFVKPEPQPKRKKASRDPSSTQVLSVSQRFNEVDDMEHIDEIIVAMRARYHYELARSPEPIYPSVFRNLGFKSPITLEGKKKRKRKRKKASAQGAAKVVELDSEPDILEVHETTVSASRNPYHVETDLPEPSNFANLPGGSFFGQAIDIGPLVAEIDNGRYPKMARLDGSKGQHKSECGICKATKAEELTPCVFCPQQVHFGCLSRRFVLKPPEPEDDFMCHLCIQRSLQRRSRAEKRRLDKAGEEPSFEVDLTQGVVEGREYECIAAQAQQLQDISELMIDAKARLQQAMAASQLNAVCRKMLHG